MSTKRIFLLAAVAALVAAPLASRAAGPTSVAGVPAARVGVHGPTSHYLQGALQLVGSTDLARKRGAPALGNNGGIALIGRCAYVARWHDYGDTDRHPGTVQYPIQIVDVAKPSAPVVVGAVPASAIHDATAREIRAVDLPNFKMLTVQTFGKYLDEGATTPGQHALSFYTFPSGNCARPVLAGHIDLAPIRPHEFYQWLDPNPDHNVNGHPRILEFVTAPLSGVDGAVVDASDPAAPKLLSVWHGGQPPPSSTEANLAGDVPAGAGRYSHSMSLSSDGTRAYVSQWDGGFLTLDSSDFAAALPAPVFRPAAAMSVPLQYEPGRPGNTHSSVLQAGTNTAIVGDEIYVTTDGCPFGWMRVVDVGDATHPPRQLGEFRLGENRDGACTGKLATSRNSLGLPVDGSFSMHNQTVTKRFVLTSWYGGGLRVIDVKDASKPVQVGAFVPKPAAATMSTPDTSAPIYGETERTDDDWWVSTWSYPIVRNGLIYVADVRSGLFVLKAAPGSALARELAGIRFLEGNSNLGDFVR